MKNKEKNFQSQQPHLKYTEIIKNLSKLLRAIFNVLLQYGNLGGWVYPAQGTIARKAGCTRQWTNKQLQELEKLGLLLSIHRGHRQTNLYIINPVFNDYSLRKMLVGFLPAFKWSWFTTALTIWQPLLTKAFNSIQSAELTLLNKGVLFNYLVLFTMRSSAYATALRSEDDARARSIVQEMLLQLPKELQREREAMEANPIMPEILALKELHLTKWGQIALMAYAPQVIKYAQQRINTKKGNLGDPFSYFVAICKSKTKEMGLQLDTAKVDFLKHAYKQPADARMVLAKQPLSRPVVPQPTPKPITPMQIEEDTDTAVDFMDDQPFYSFSKPKEIKTPRSPLDLRYPRYPEIPLHERLQKIEDGTCAADIDRVLADPIKQEQYNKNLAMLGLASNTNPFSKGHKQLQQTITNLGWSDVGIPSNLNQDDQQ